MKTQTMIVRETHIYDIDGIELLTEKQAEELVAALMTIEGVWHYEAEMLYSPEKNIKLWAYSPIKTEITRVWKTVKRNWK